MKESSKIVHKGRDSTKHFGTVNTPIYQTSTIVFPTVEDYERAEEEGKGYYEPIFGQKDGSDPAYGIAGSQTSYALQDLLKELEEADNCFLTPSGLNAITLSLTSLLKSGDHILITDAVYGPTRRFCNKTLKRFGVEIEYYDPEIGADIKDLVKENTKVIFLESPGSLTFEIQDLEEIVKIAKEHDIYTIIDNSWATPLFLKPINLGIDISIHAITKYINGSSDLLMGAVITNERTSSIIRREYKSTGVSVSPQECFLVLKGVRTLKARLDYQSKSLTKIFKYLEDQPKVKKILAPSHPEFEGYELWKKYFTGQTALFSIELDKDYSFEQICEMINGYKIFGIGASWGGFESLVRYFRLENIRSKPQTKFQSSLVRFYIGLEDVDDIIDDLENGFKRL